MTNAIPCHYKYIIHRRVILLIIEMECNISITQPLNIANDMMYYDYSLIPSYECM